VAYRTCAPAAAWFSLAAAGSGALRNLCPCSVEFLFAGAPGWALHLWWLSASRSGSEGVVALSWCWPVDVKAFALVLVAFAWRSTLCGDGCFYGVVGFAAGHLSMDFWPGFLFFLCSCEQFVMCFFH